MQARHAEDLVASHPKKVASYNIEDVLGRGGMGEVYLATHELLGRSVALKRLVLPENSPQDADLTERFIREGKALAELSHHGIVGVFDLFQWRNHTYMAMERVDGKDLHELLGSGSLPVDVAAIIGARLAEALDYAHLHRIVHRDIKPANVMVSVTGDIKLMDFGVARNENLDELTRTGMMVGTPRFLAPEVVKGEVADARSDIYALGCVLYQMLAGRHPFAHATADTIFPLIASGKFEKLGSVAQVPRTLRKIVDKCLTTSPDKRYQSCADVAHDLERFLDRSGAFPHHTQRLVAYFSQEGHIAQSDALTVIQADDLAWTAVAPTLSDKSAPLKAAMLSLSVLLFLASVALAILQPQWFSDWFQSVTSSVGPAPDLGSAATPPKSPRGK